MMSNNPEINGLANFKGMSHTVWGALFEKSTIIIGFV